MKELLRKHDLGYCEGQSDLDGIYYFTLKNMEDFHLLFQTNKQEFQNNVFALRRILDALFPEFNDFNKEWQRYRSMFLEYFIHAKAKRCDIEFIKQLFDLSQFNSTNRVFIPIK